jgi:hypothetical protein
MSEMLEAALKYARRGWLVLPLKPGTKEPLIKNGFLNASNAEDTITSWWSRTPDANIGIRVGLESNLFIIDIDNKGGKDGNERLKELEGRFGRLPATYVVKTPNGGFHYYFTYPEVLKGRPIKKELAQGVDLKFNGYVVAPPSKLADDQYAIVTEEGANNE